MAFTDEVGFHVALGLSEDAAVGKGAFSSELGEVGRGASDAFESVLPGSWERVEERAGVGVGGRTEDLLGGSGFDDFSGVEDGDAVGDRGDCADVVGDKDNPGAFFLLQLSEEAEDLGLEGDVEGGGWLVGDEDLGATGERHCDDHALLLATGHLVGVLAGAFFGRRDSDFVEHFDRFDSSFGHGESLVEAIGLGDLVSNTHHGVERREGVLHDEGDFLSSDLTIFSFGETGELTAFELNGTLSDSAGALEHAHDCEARHRLSATGLSDDSEGFSGRQIEGNAS